uniref:Uncharacterized protein n=1 Tax=Ditylenchus dipsaci TaxID=166011 RepID=A0A915EGM1_9BILA
MGHHQLDPLVLLLSNMFHFDEDFDAEDYDDNEKQNSTTPIPHQHLGNIFGSEELWDEQVDGKATRKTSRRKEVKAQEANFYEDYFVDYNKFTLLLLVDALVMGLRQAIVYTCAINIAAAGAIVCMYRIVVGGAIIVGLRPNWINRR